MFVAVDNILVGAEDVFGVNYQQTDQFSEKIIVLEWNRDIIRRSLTADEKAEVKVIVGRGLKRKLISGWVGLIIWDMVVVVFKEKDDRARSII